MRPGPSWASYGGGHIWVWVFALILPKKTYKKLRGNPNTSLQQNPFKVSSRNKISIVTDISVLEFYGYIENIGKYQLIF